LQKLRAFLDEVTLLAKTKGIITQTVIGWGTFEFGFGSTLCSVWDGGLGDNQASEWTVESYYT